MSIGNYDRGSVERALEFHQGEGRIRRWLRKQTGGEAKRDPHNRWAVELSNCEMVELVSLREAWVFVLGLASASIGQRKKERAAAEAADRERRTV